MCEKTVLEFLYNLYLYACLVDLFVYLLVSDRNDKAIGILYCDSFITFKTFLGLDDGLFASFLFIIASESVLSCKV